MISPKIILASHNAGKVKQFQSLVTSEKLTFISAETFGIPEPEETGITFEENACLKAQFCANFCNDKNLPALADDSGLVIPALNGDPGIYSARWAGPERNFKKAIDRIETRLKNHTDHTAFFVCVLALAYPKGPTRIYRAEWKGTLTFPPKGSNGFAYDSIFIPDGFSKTVGELSIEEKNKHSHRSLAFQKFLDDFLSEYHR